MPSLRLGDLWRLSAAEYWILMMDLERDSEE
jgi:hypothetical protein